jgi:Domain of unknown function (DUF4439)
VTPLAALQAALAAEQATVYGYGVAGSILRDGDRDDATAALHAHQLLRDRLIALITAAGASPAVARVAYRLPFPVTNEAAARELAHHLEQGCAGALWDLIAASTPSTRLRSLAIGWLSDTAERAAHWGALQALPGQPA